MKKAKEFAAEFRSSLSKGEPFDTAALKVAREMLIEIEEISKMRNTRSSSAFAAIAVEQSRKWKAFVDRVSPDHPGLEPNGFASYFSKIWEKTTGRSFPSGVLEDMLLA